jgi:glycosyltransferase involved in cell wall biosynthesis
MLNIIIPANNEEAYIGRCLDAVLAQQLPDGAPAVRVVVAANACTDETVALARAAAPRAAALGWVIEVLDLPQGGKAGALNAADRLIAAHDPAGIRVYLDADVVMSPLLLAALWRALDRPEAAYASGKLIVARAQSAVTRAYARIWARLPFMTEGVPGAGLFAVNAAGRARWGEFPAIISDDTYVRLQFASAERIGVEPGFEWPMVEGFSNLVRVRRRQDAGVAEVARLHPELMRNEGKAPLTRSHLAGLALRDPLGFAIYVAVALGVRMRRDAGRWSRGR